MYVYINGEIQEAGAARLSVFEHGFMYGLGLFETFRIYNGHPFLLDDHFHRMEKGLESMNIPWKYNRETILSQLHMLQKANGWKNAYVRYNISAGPGNLGLSTEPYETPTVIIYMKPLSPLKGKQTASKKAAFLTVPRNTPETPIRLKSHHFLNNILGKRETGPDPEVEGLFLTEQGFVAEGVVSNIFWRKGNALYTPSLQTGILDGVTRSLVMRIAEKHGYYLREGCFQPSHVIEAEEAFVTNSIQEIVPLTEIDTKVCYHKETTAVDLFQQEYALHRESLWKVADIF
ncbi:aminodeoxychorismate lyase [Salibacterium aidingense]|uniref:aminodeoxychorismate lyase n=1 Tax=Salibacterium aidingense TaxID=384933 RepID=UPI00041349E6|nr:aminodeoxychorismate lyase [Salibacterium aidingense]